MTTLAMEGAPEVGLRVLMGLSGVKAPGREEKYESATRPLLRD